MKAAALFFKVLADESRLQILWLLSNHRELCVCDIMAALEITQSKASRHLGTLRHAGLVSDRKEGLWSYYALRPVEDGFAKRQLTLLKSSLADRPNADQLLERLRGSLRTHPPAAATVRREALQPKRVRAAGTTR